MSQDQIRGEGAFAAPPGDLFSVPLGTAEEATSARPIISVPVSVECDFYGRNVVQVPGPVALQSGAGFVGAGQSVPVPTGRLIQRWRPLVSVPLDLSRQNF